MLTVAQVAEKSGLSPHTVRYYLQIGLITPSAQGANQYRLFDQRALNQLRFIAQAKRLGFTLKEIQQILRHAAQGESPCEEVRELIQHHIAENQKKIDQLQRLQTTMQQALAQWQTMPNKSPNGHSICHLIESLQSALPLESGD